MKQVIFVRHAKSDWGNEYLKDMDRYLAERGYSDAYFLSEWFNKNHAAPDRIIASTATRALSTALIFARALDFNMACFQLEKEIYEGSVATLLSIIKEQDDSKKTLMLFGHNPGFTNICNDLSEDMYFDNVPTCGLVSFNFDISSWSEIEAKKGKLNFYQYPKDFKNKD
jgi:phosphohistidine phosphatase